jgi:HAD superfamily hydrolase (TIGR01484 family)
MDPDKHYLRLILDLDNTITRTHEKIAEDMRSLLASLKYDIVIMSTHDAYTIHTQIDGLACHILGQHGNEAGVGDTILWRDILTNDERAEIMAHIQTLPRTWAVPNDQDLVDDRGCTISFSLYGHHAPIKDKQRFDPDQAIRLGLLTTHPMRSNSIEVRIGETTTLDYLKKGHTKGFNIARLCAYKGWNLDTCLYIGDALEVGGNDDTVIGIVDTHSVTNPDDTQQFLTSLQA